MTSGVGATYLDRIIPCVRRRLDEHRRTLPQAELESTPGPGPRPSFAAAIGAPGVSLIAEVKRASPSKGMILPDLDVQSLVRKYERAGARAISVVTEQDHFLGNLDDLRAAVSVASLPLLRKDFILDDYQIHEARVYGASAILLIAALLTNEQLASMANLAADLGLDVLLEVHYADELDRALRVEHAVIGINNRDLRTFEVSLATTERLAPRIPPNRLVVGESGIWSHEDVTRLEAVGVDGVLVGESLLRSSDVERAIEELMQSRSSATRNRASRGRETQ